MEDTRSNGSGLTYVGAPVTSLEEHLQEIRAITDELVELDPGGYKLVFELTTN
jgi:hypothetical protein